MGSSWRCLGGRWSGSELQGSDGGKGGDLRVTTEVDRAGDPCSLLTAII